MSSRSRLFRRATPVAVAVMVLLGGCGGDDDTDGAEGESGIDIDTDTEASAPSSTTSVPADEGIDDPLAVFAEVTSEQVVPPIAADVVDGGRFEALLEDAGRLCLAFEGLQPQSTEIHLHVGAAGETGDVYLDLGPGLTASDGAGADVRTGCIDIDAEIEDALASSTDAFYVDVHTEDHPDGAWRGQLQATSIFDLQLFG